VRPSPAEYIYFPEKTGTYDLSVYVPFTLDLSINACYTVVVNDEPMYTFQMDQRASAYRWVSLGRINFPAGAKINLTVVDSDRTSQVSYLAIDAVRFSYLGLGDFEPPLLTASDTLENPQYIQVTSNEEGVIYMVPENTARDLEQIRSSSIDSNRAFANIEVQFSIAGLENDIYWMYARDTAMNVSQHESFTITSVGTPHNRNEQIRIYPNPVTDKLIIEKNSAGKYTISIFSLKGQLLSREEAAGVMHEVDLSSFTKGVYYITIFSNDFITTRKIVKLL
jgi:hypothetical protein